MLAASILAACDVGLYFCAALPGQSLKLACYDINLDAGDSECADRIGIEADQYSMYVNGVIKPFPSQVSGLTKQASSYRVRNKRLGRGRKQEKVPCFGGVEGNAGCHSLILTR